jgi:hypothetical protein
MRLFRYLQHWLTGHGTRLQVADFVPTIHPLRQWMAEGLVSPAHLLVDTLSCGTGKSTGHRCHDTLQGSKKVLHLVETIATQCATQATRLKRQTQTLHHTLKQIMCRFGRQCRGQGKVFVTLVRETEKRLLECGNAVPALAQAAQQCLRQATHLAERQRERVEGRLQAALETITPSVDNRSG